jgi:hypothetical protein
MRSAEEIGVERDEIPWAVSRAGMRSRADDAYSSHLNCTLRLFRTRRAVEFSGGILEVLDPP